MHGNISSKLMYVLDWDITQIHMNTVQPAKEVVIRIPSYKSTITRNCILLILVKKSRDITIVYSLNLCSSIF